MADSFPHPYRASLGDTLRALVVELGTSQPVAQPGRPVLAETEIRLGFALRGCRGQELEISLAESLLAFRRRFSRRRETLQTITLLLKGTAGGTSTEPRPGSLAALLGNLRSDLAGAGGAVPWKELEIETNSEYALSRSRQGTLRVAVQPVSLALTRSTGSSISEFSKLRVKWISGSRKDNKYGGD